MQVQSVFEVREALRSGVWWDDERFPAQAITLGGLTSPPDREVDTGLLLFDPLAIEVIAGLAQMPHTWIEGSPIYPHVHWTKTSANAGEVVWSFRYRWANFGAVFTPWSSVLASTGVIPHGDTDWQHALNVFAPVPLPSGTVSCCILFQLGRIAPDAYADDARLIEFDLHYQKNALGSELEYLKYDADPPAWAR